MSRRLVPLNQLRSRELGNKYFIKELEPGPFSGPFSPAFSPAGQVAELMWPDSRRSNAAGQTMHVGSAVAARMLRRTKGVTEIEPRRWELWGFGA
jgi:hypothetical protein